MHQIRRLNFTETVRHSATDSVDVAGVLPVGVVGVGGVGGDGVAAGQWSLHSLILH